MQHLTYAEYRQLREARDEEDLELEEVEEEPAPEPEPEPESAPEPEPAPESSPEPVSQDSPSNDSGTVSQDTATTSAGAESPQDTLKRMGYTEMANGYYKPPPNLSNSQVLHWVPGMTQIRPIDTVGAGLSGGGFGGGGDAGGSGGGDGANSRGGSGGGGGRNSKSSWAAYDDYQKQTKAARAQQRIARSNAQKSRDNQLRQWSEELYGRASGEEDTLAAQKEFAVRELSMPEQYRAPTIPLLSYQEWLARQR